MNIRLKPATINGIDTITYINVKCWKLAYRGIVPDEYLDNLTFESRRKLIERLIVTPPFERQKTLVAEQVSDSENSVVGFVTFGKANQSSKILELVYGAFGEIYAIYVEPNVWGTGVGRTLLKAAVTELRRDGFYNTLLWVYEENVTSRGFYEKLGFAADGAKRSEEISGRLANEVRYIQIGCPTGTLR